MLRIAGKPAEAERLYSEALPGLESKLGKGHANTASARLGRGRSLADLNRLAEAERELTEAERALSSAPGVPATKHRECLEALVALYDSWEKVEPGKGHDARAAEWKAKLAAIKPVTPQKK